MGHGPKMPSGTPRPVAQPDPDSVEAVEEETTDTTNTTNATDTTDTTDTNDTTGDSDTADDTDDTDDTDTTVDTATTDGTDDSDTTETTESDSDTDADADADADADTEESDSDDENDFLVDANTDGSFSVHHSAATVTVEAAAPTETGRNITQDRLRAKKAEPNAWFRPLNGDKVEKCTQGCKISVQISNDNVNVASIGMSGTGENQGFSGRAARFVSTYSLGEPLRMQTRSNKEADLQYRPTARSSISRRWSSPVSATCVPAVTASERKERTRTVTVSSKTGHGRSRAAKAAMRLVTFGLPSRWTSRCRSR